MPYVYSIKISAFYTKFGGTRSVTDLGVIFHFLEKLCSIVLIGVAPFTQPTHVRDKNSNIQGRSPNVVKVIFHTLRNCSQRKKNSLPLGANSFL